MNVALVFAGGSGRRMNIKARPKQFLELHGKPIIIYTLEHFDVHPSIDAIVVVCIESWIPRLQKMLKKYEIGKVAAIVPGGETGQQSIYNGIAKAHELYPEDTMLLVHDGVRPLIDEDTITNALDCAYAHGNAVTVTPAVETIAINNREECIGEIVDRSTCKLVRAPQCFRLGTLYEAHQRAREEGMTAFIDSASMMKHYGSRLHWVEGPEFNIKITTPTDFYIFAAIVDAQADSQIFGL